jgi:hypothetical protein
MAVLQRVGNLLEQKRLTHNLQRLYYWPEVRGRNEVKYSSLTDDADQDDGSQELEVYAGKMKRIHGKIVTSLSTVNFLFKELKPLPLMKFS